jgi:hypothetical protein
MERSNSSSGVRPLNVAQKYTQAVLAPQLRSLGLSKRQWEIVVEDVKLRLESLLFHWSDVSFRRTVLVHGTEEAIFWRPHSASLEIRSLVVVAVRNSPIEDFGASHPYTKALRSRKTFLSDSQMPWITSEAISAFQNVELGVVRDQPRQDIFGDLRPRFPNAWLVLSLLGNSFDSEIKCDLPMAASEQMDSSVYEIKVQQHNVVASGIDPRLDSHLLETLGMIKRGELDMLVSPSFKASRGTP